MGACLCACGWVCLHTCGRIQVCVPCACVGMGRCVCLCVCVGGRGCLCTRGLVLARSGSAPCSPDIILCHFRHPIFPFCQHPACLWSDFPGCPHALRCHLCGLQDLTRGPFVQGPLTLALGFLNKSPERGSWTLKSPLLIC